MAAMGKPMIAISKPGEGRKMAKPVSINEATASDMNHLVPLLEGLLHRKM
jgi:hypothetical protein